MYYFSAYFNKACNYFISKQYVPCCTKISLFSFFQIITVKFKLYKKSKYIFFKYYSCISSLKYII